MSSRMPPKSIQAGHIHGEAFMLMWYECKCGHKERIWNSRDGVTPFCLGCPSCGGISLQHTDWRKDVFRPHHVPSREQRFFRDGTPDEAEAIIRRRIAMIRGGDDKELISDLTPEREAQLIAAARNPSEEHGEFPPGWPFLARTPDSGPQAIGESHPAARTYADRAYIVLAELAEWYGVREQALQAFNSRQVGLDNQVPAALLITADGFVKVRQWLAQTRDSAHI